jgi:hypothetical protein
VGVPGDDESDIKAQPQAVQVRASCIS